MAFPVPIEVVPFTLPWVTREIARAHPHAEIVLRGGAEKPYETDNHNVLLDCRFGSIADPRGLDAALRNIHGVVDTGLFVGLTSVVFVGGTADLTVREARWFAAAGYTAKPR